MWLEANNFLKRVWKAQNGYKRKRAIQLESVPKMSNNIDSLSTSPLVKVERIDFIGVADFLCIFNPCLIYFVNSLKINII